MKSTFALLASGLTLSFASPLRMLPSSHTLSDDTPTVPTTVVSTETQRAGGVVCSRWGIVPDETSGTFAPVCRAWDGTTSDELPILQLQTVKLVDESAVCSSWHVEAHEEIVTPVCGEISAKPTASISLSPAMISALATQFRGSGFRGPPVAPPFRPVTATTSAMDKRAAEATTTEDVAKIFADATAVAALTPEDISAVRESIRESIHAGVVSAGRYGYTPSTSAVAADATETKVVAKLFPSTYYISTRFAVAPSTRIAAAESQTTADIAEIVASVLAPTSLEVATSTSIAAVDAEATDAISEIFSAARAASSTTEQASSTRTAAVIAEATNAVSEIFAAARSSHSRKVASSTLIAAAEAQITPDVVENFSSATASPAREVASSSRIAATDTVSTDAAVEMAAIADASPDLGVLTGTAMAAADPQTSADVSEIAARGEDIVCPMSPCRWDCPPPSHMLYGYGCCRPCQRPEHMKTATATADAEATAKSFPDKLKDFAIDVADDASKLLPGKPKDKDEDKMCAHNGAILHTGAGFRHVGLPRCCAGLSHQPCLDDEMEICCLPIVESVNLIRPEMKEGLTARDAIHTVSETPTALARPSIGPHIACAAMPCSPNCVGKVPGAKCAYAGAGIQPVPRDAKHKELSDEDLEELARERLEYGDLVDGDFYYMEHECGPDNEFECA